MMIMRLIRIFMLFVAALMTVNARADFRLEIKPLMSGATGSERQNNGLLSSGNNIANLIHTYNQGDSAGNAGAGDSFAQYCASIYQSISLKSQGGFGSFSLPDQADLIADLMAGYGYSGKSKQAQAAMRAAIWEAIINGYANGRNKSHHSHSNSNHFGSQDFGNGGSNEGGGRFGPDGQGGNGGQGPSFQQAPAPPSLLLAAVGVVTAGGMGLRRLFGWRRN